MSAIVNMEQEVTERIPLLTVNVDDTTELVDDTPEGIDLTICKIIVRFK